MNKPRKSSSNSGQSPKTAAKKTLKVLLSPTEHAVVTTAASLSGLGISEYMRQAVLAKAKLDAKKLDQILDSM